MSRTIFKNANLLDGENPAQKGTTIVVEGDRISAVTSGASVLAQASDTVIDLNGLTLMPGMVSGHYHAAYSQSGDHAVPMDAPESRQAYQALGNVQTALRLGYTSLVGAGTFFDIDANLAASIDSGAVAGPRLIPSSRAITPSPVGGADREDSPYINHEGPDAVREATLREIERGAKIIKLFAASGHALLGTREMTEDELRAAAEVAHEHGVRTRAHVCGRDAVLRCVRAGIRIIDHADGMDDECIEALVENDCFVLPSLFMPYLTKIDPDAPGAELFDPKDFDEMVGVLPKAIAAGIKFVPGDDYGFGVLAHGDYPGELACYVEGCGIDALEVIKWATKYGGELTGVPDLGTIAPGKIADMVIVDGDPSQDIRVLTKPQRILAVIKGGELISGKLPVAQLEMA
jgi:imidazolonepropionase-like amidohydrolase